MTVVDLELGQAAELLAALTDAEIAALARDPDEWRLVVAIAEAELLARAEPEDVFAVMRYLPTARQQEFHDATEYDVLYGGAAGGGKTKSLLMDDLRDAMTYPGIRIGAFRRTYDELAESLLKELEACGFAAALGASWNASKHDLRFPNGSMIRYRYARTIEDATARQGGEYQKITIDERSLMPPGVVDVLAERLRSGRADVPVLGIRSGSNPGGPAHAETKQRYIVGTNHGEQVYTDEYGFTVRFIPAKVADNPHVDSAYRRRLEAIPDPQRRKAMLDGDWDVFAGQYFAEWRHRLHVVAPFEVPVEWRRVAGIDYGYAKPWAVEWLAVDSDQRVWVYREAYKTGVTERDQARTIVEAEADDPRVDRFADPAMWAKTGAAPSPAKAYEDEGVQLRKAVNDRVPGWQRVHSFLSEMAPACAHHRLLGLDECPMLHVFETCSNLIRTLPALPHDDKKVEDVDTDAEDHAPDALRYALMALRKPVEGAAVVPMTQRLPAASRLAGGGGGLASVGMPARLPSVWSGR